MGVALWFRALNLNQGGKLFEKYQCSRQNIIDNKHFKIRDRDYVTFFYGKGKVIV